jgi:hypothetical protein
MYTHYNNQFDEAFKRLPRDLQWEILVDFVGGYVVRYNRLKRFICGDDIYTRIMNHQFELNFWSARGGLWLKRPVEPVHSGVDNYGFSILLYHALNRGTEVHFRILGDGQGEEHSELLVPVVSAEFITPEMYVMLFKTRHTERLSYGYTNKSGQWYITEIDDSVTLPPYEKHVYPSYPYTNKKLGRPLLKMKLYDPIFMVVPDHHVIV